MRKFTTIVIIVVIVVIVATGAVVLWQEKETPHIGTCQWPRISDTTMSGNIGARYANAWVAVVTNGDQYGPVVTERYPWSGKLLGMAQVQADGSFQLRLSQAVEKGECLEVWLSKHGNTPESHWYLVKDNRCNVPLNHSDDVDLLLFSSFSAGGYFLWKRKSKFK